MKIGFIDYYLDEFHANKYPAWIEEASGGRLKVAYAYGLKDKEDGLTNAEWSEKYGVQLLDTIEEVVASSDGLIVLSPDNPEYHEQLSELALRSGKPTYIDKTFAPDRAAALRLIELAKQNETPMYSTSALRFADEYANIERDQVEVISSWGPGTYANYSIHQIEPIVALMGAQPLRIMAIGTETSPSIVIDYGAGKQATIRQFTGDCPFMMAVQSSTRLTKLVKVESNFFGAFIHNLVGFFESGVPAVNTQETVAVITLIEYGTKAMQALYQWIDLPNE